MTEREARRRTMLNRSNPTGSVKQTEVNIELNGVILKYDNTMLSSLPDFHGHANENPLEFLDDLHIRCSSQNIPGISTEILKMKYFALTLKDKAKEWYRNLGITFTS